MGEDTDNTATNDLQAVLAALAEVTAQVRSLTARQHALIAHARAAGATWAQVAEVLEVTVQAAHKRYRDVRVDHTGRAWRERQLPL